MAPKKKARTVEVANLATATSASVKAVLRKAAVAIPKGGGTTVGIVISNAALAASGANPLGLAKDIAKNVSAATGVRVTATTAKAGDGILVGFITPRAFLTR